jgi:DNA (cytosine-5)-methyltransferase 1
MSKLKVLELFSGIGALSKALERLGIEHEIVDAVEIDKYAVASFNAIHNTNFEPQDICEWNKDIETDLIMHGSPCQDFSLAGKQAGGDEGSGTRSSLMYETLRIVEKLKPEYVIWENVKNVISKKHIHNFNNYIERMSELGYTSHYQVLNAKDYGIPQNRERVFTISILGNENYKFPSGVECNNKIDMVEKTQKVKVRKYKVDIEKLKNTLRKHKNISNKTIAESLNKPLTLVEHWFRKDNCFSIPDADIWFSLKTLLNIETNEFDEAITTFEEKDNMYEKSNRFYYDTGLAPTITSTSANEKIIQTFTFPPKQELKLKLKDMLEDEVDEKYYLSDIVIDKITRHKNKIIENENPNESSTLHAGYYKMGGRDQQYIKDSKIRKLTPREVWRLMGFDDEDFEKAEKVNSNTQLYKQAGNSICVNVLEAILNNLLGV